MLSALGALVFPASCPGCGVASEPVCARCAATLVPAPSGAATVRGRRLGRRVRVPGSGAGARGATEVPERPGGAGVARHRDCRCGSGARHRSRRRHLGPDHAAAPSSTGVRPRRAAGPSDRDQVGPAAGGAVAASPGATADRARPCRAPERTSVHLPVGITGAGLGPPRRRREHDRGEPELPPRPPSELVEPDMYDLSRLLGPRVHPTVECCHGA